MRGQSLVCCGLLRRCQSSIVFPNYCFLGPFGGQQSDHTFSSNQSKDGEDPAVDDRESLSDIDDDEVLFVLCSLYITSVNFPYDLSSAFTMHSFCSLACIIEMSAIPYSKLYHLTFLPIHFYSLGEIWRVLLGCTNLNYKIEIEVLPPHVLVFFMFP